MLDISLILPVKTVAWMAMALACMSVALMALLSMLSSAVHSITESESRKLHRSKDRRQQRVYKFYQRKEKVKAALAAVETMLALCTVLALTSLTSGSLICRGNAVLVFHNPSWPAYVAYFVLLAFVLVIAAVVPGRMISESRKLSLLLRYGWIVEAVHTLAAPLSFCNSYSNTHGGDTGNRIAVSLDGESPHTGEKDMIRNILQFGDIEVREIMTPRHDIVFVHKADTFSVVKKTIEESNFSRLPVCEDNPDTVFGIVYVKDLLPHVSEGDSFDWNKLIRRITYVSENKKISDLLKEFQMTKNHMAAVSDEYGGISGLITMQDILEKIVGEMSDEFDIEEITMFQKLSDNHYIFDGRIMLDDFCRELGLETTYFDELKGDAESLAGLLLELRGEFPSSEESISCRDLTFSVELFSGRRIEKISVKL